MVYRITDFLYFCTSYFESKQWKVEKPRDFDPFGQTGFAHLWLQYN